MVTDEQTDQPVATAESPHRHRPLIFSEPYVELGVKWVIGICECGQQLSPRRLTAVRKASA